MQEGLINSSILTDFQYLITANYPIRQVVIAKHGNRWVTILLPDQIK